MFFNVRFTLFRQEMRNVLVVKTITAMMMTMMPLKAFSCETSTQVHAVVLHDLSVVDANLPNVLHAFLQIRFVPCTVKEPLRYIGLRLKHTCLRSTTNNAT